MRPGTSRAPVEAGGPARAEGPEQLSELLRLVRQRLDVACEVADAKRAAGLPVLDPAREAAVVRHAGEFARDHDLDEEDMRSLFWALIGLTRRAELTT